MRRDDPLALWRVCKRFVAVALLLGCVCCAPVRAWERESLAHVSMNSEAANRAAHQAFVRHVFDVREGATGGLGRAGGGCGCN